MKESWIIHIILMSVEFKVGREIILFLVKGTSNGSLTFDKCVEGSVFFLNKLYLRVSQEKQNVSVLKLF